MSPLVRSRRVPSSQSRSARRLFRTRLEALEDRRLLSTFQWKSAADGDFNTPANWVQNSVPGVNDDAIIGFSNITVTVAVGTTVNTLNNSSRLTVSSGTFAVQNGAGNSSLNQLIVANGATFRTVSGTTTVTSNASLNGTIQVDAGAEMDFQGGAVAVPGTAALNGPGTFGILGATFTVSGNVTAPTHLVFSSGTLNGNGNFTIPTGTTMNWTGGVMGGAGTTIVANSASLAISGGAGKVLDTRTLTNNGTITLSGTTDVTINNGALLDNYGLFDIKVDHGVGSGGTQPTFINEAGGTLRKSGGSGASTFSGNIAFNNAGGTVDNQTGTLSLIGGTSQGGNFKAAANTLLDLNGADNTTFTGTFTGSGAGTVRISGGTITIGAAGATFNFPSGLLQWTGGTIDGGGVATLINADTIAFPGAGSRTFNAITVANPSGSSLVLTGTGPLQIYNGTVLNNAGMVDFQGDASIGSGGTTPSFNNQNTGIVRKSGGTGTSDFGGNLAFNNAPGATVTTQTGTLRLTSGTFSGGTFNASSGALLDMTDANNATFAGTFTGNGGGTVRLSGGTVTIGPAGATFNFPSGLFQWTNGTIDGAGTGTLTNTGAITLTGNTNHVFNALNFVNATGAIVSLQGAGLLSFYNGDTIANAGLFDVQSDASFGSGGAASSFTNQASGTFRKSGGTGVTTLPIAFSNAGTVDTQTGMLKLVGGTDTGTYNTANIGTVNFYYGTRTINAGAKFIGTGTVLVSDEGSSKLLLNANQTIANVNFASGTITGTATLTVSGLFSWTGGTLIGPTNLVIAPTATLAFGGVAAMVIDAATITNQGTATWPLTGALYVRNGATFNNVGTVLDSADHTMTYNGGNGLTFNNTGTYTKTSGNGTTRLEVAFNNTGTVNILSGTLQLQGPGTDTGTYGIAAGATLNFSYGTRTFNPGVKVNGAGALLMTDEGSSRLAFNTDTSLTSLTLAAGTITGPSTVTVTNAFRFTGGMVQGPGAMLIPATATMAITGPSSKIVDAYAITNQGTTTWPLGGPLYVRNGSTFQNNGTFLDLADHTMTFNGGNGLTFNNAGTYTKTSGNGTTRLEVAFNNSGTVNIASGTLQLNGGGTDTGPYNLSAGTTLNYSYGTRTINAGAAFIGPGTVLLTDEGGASSIVPNVDVAIPNFVLSAGTLKGPNTVTVSGAFSFTGGTMQGPGAVTIGPAGTLAISGSNTRIIDAYTILNQGTSTWAGTGAFYVRNGAVFNNAGLFLDQDDHTMSYNGGAGLTFNNTGEYRRTTASGETQLQIGLNNTGTVRVDSGKLSIAATNQDNGDGVLSGGTWIVGTNANLNLATNLNATGNITTNKGTVMLMGQGALFNRLSTLTTNRGTLQLEGGLDFTTVGDLTNSGTLVLGPASVLNVNGTYAQTAAGSLFSEIAGQPASGLFGQLTATGAANLNGTHGPRLVNGFGTTAGGNFVVMSYASRTGDFSSFQNVTEGGAGLFTHATNATNVTFTTVKDATDLIVTDVSMSSRVSPGRPLAIQYTVRNNSNVSSDVTTWTDSVFLSLSDTFDPTTAIFLGTATHTGGVAANGSYNGSLTVAAPGVAINSYRVFVVADGRQFVPDPNRANNIGRSGTTVSIDFPSLTLGTTLNSTIDSGQDLYYRIDLPTGSAVRITANFAATPGGEVFASYRQVPSRTVADASATDPTLMTQQLLLSGAQAGTEYVLVHGREGSLGGKPFSLKVEQLPLQVLQVGPQVGGNSGSVTLAITGSQFTSAALVSLVQGGQARPAASVSFQDGQTLFATFNLNGLAPGLYDVQVTQGLNSAALPGAFRVVAGTAGKVRTELTIQPVSRPGRPGLVTLDFENAGDTDVAAPIFVLTAKTRSGRLIPMTLPGDDGPGRSPLQFLGINPDGQAGVLPPRFQRSIPITFHVPPDIVGHDYIQFQLTTVSGNDLPIDWAAQKAVLKPDYVPDDAWDAVFTNFVAAVGTTSASYQATLSADATYLSSLGDVTPDVPRLFAYEVAKADNALMPKAIASSVDAAFPAPGLWLEFDRQASQSISGRYFTGRFGRGWTDNWDYQLTTDAKGNASMRLGPTTRFFAKQADGSYMGSMGDHGMLTQSGGVFQLREVDGNVESFRPDGLLDFKRDPNGNRITCGYTGGLLTSLTHSNGSAITINYNGQGRVSQITDPAGRASTYTYDATGQHLLTYTNKFGTTQYGYVTGQGPQREHALASITYSDNTHINFTYDTQGRLIGNYRDGGAEPLAYAYDTAGGYSITDGVGAKTTYRLNDFGQVAQSIDPLGGVTRLFYDMNMDLVKQVLPDGSAYTFSYDTRGNLTSRVSPSGGRVAMTYEPAFNQLTSFEDERGNTTRYDIDARGNVITMTYADDTSVQFGYDAVGNLISLTNARGQRVVMSYDKNGLVTSQVLPDGSQATFAYDPRGNLVSATNANGTLAFTYGALDLPTRVVTPNGALDIAYNGVGQRTRVADQTGLTVNYAHDALGRVQALTDGGGNPIVAYTYDLAGRPVTETKGNGTTTTYQFDLAGQILSLVHKAPNGSVNSQYDYTYDIMGRVATMRTGGVTTTYGHDLLGQLTSLTAPGRSIQYQYDPAGNRVSVNDNGAVTPYVTNNRNQYTNIGPDSFTYDADGNLATRVVGGSTTTYNFDPIGRLAGISGPGGASSFAYDALSERIGSTVSGVTTRDLVDPISRFVFATFDATGATVAHYPLGIGVVGRVAADGSAAYFDYDSIGSTVGLTNAAGSYINRYSYQPFGATTTISAGLTNPFTYVGRYGVSTNADGTLQMRARSYDPATGQFLSNDPLGLGGGDTNTRRYVNNDPLNAIDPSGLKGYRRSNASPYRVTPSSAPFYNKGYEPYPPGGYNGWIKEFRADNQGYLYRPVQTDARGNPTYESNDAFTNMAGDPVPHGDPPGQGGGAGGGGSDCNPDNTPPNDPPNPPGGPGGGGDSDPRTPNDPNEIVGPAGFGPKRFIAPPTQTLPYTVLFENKATAAAPAQDVIVTQQLDPNLDWTTFALGSIGFGSTTVDVPAGRNFFSSRVDARASLGLFVDITANLNLTTGLVTWKFQSIDPKTGDITLDPLAGFLPPNTSPPIGDGYVNYTIKAKPGLVTGAAFSAKASIVFDTNAAIETNTAVNTIDANVPTSTVLALPPNVATASFPVSWTGDDGAGSGIAGYDVYASTNGGPFSLWQAGTTATSATFNGQLGQTYAFYSVAVDNVGHRQATPSAAQATTTVNNPAPPTTSTTLSVYANPTVANQAVRLTATVAFTSASQGNLLVGNVVFRDGNQVLGTVPLSANGVVQFTTQPLTSLGNHTLSATFVSLNSVVGSAGNLTQIVQTAALEPDPSNPSLMALAVGTSSGNATIELVSQKGSKPVQVKVNGKSIGSFAPTGALLAYGGPSRSTIKVDRALRQTALLFGSSGTNTITAGGGPTVLVGGPGTDTLNGGPAACILIGGTGKNTLTAGSGGSILIGGKTNYDRNEAALLALLSEWRGGESIDTKIAHMKAGSHLAKGVPLNTTTALNAGAVDTLIGGTGTDWFLNLSTKDTLRTYDLKRDRFNVKPKR